MAFVTYRFGSRIRGANTGDALIAAAVTLLLLAYHAATGFPSLADSGGDNDSMLRLVQVRDLLSGQGWFDLTQYRMGPEGGFTMHWSRLVDLPIALLAAAFGEAVALVAWPMLLFALSLALIIRAARALGGEATLLPATVLGGLALYFVNVYRPGALDHHNVQLTLGLATLYLLLRGSQSAAAALLAGLCAALMLAVGMETAPYVAVACAVAALSFLAGGEGNLRLARGFGAGFAGTAALALAATSPVQDWLAVHCDAYSFPQASLAILGGGGLLIAASMPAVSGNLPRRAAALAVLGAAAGAALVAGFPQCLAAPYADLDPRLHTFFIDEITEAQAAADILRNRPSQFLVYYATPLVALGVLAWGFARTGWNRDRAVVTAFVAAAVLVSLWQVRGSTFAIPFAAVPLGAWVTAARTRALEDKRPGTQLAMLGAWIVSVNLVWQAAGTVLSPGARAADWNAGKAECYAHADYAALAALPAGTVAGVSNLGSSILANTPHRALAGPYHRNEAGLLGNLDLLMAAPAEAEAVARRLGVDYVAACPGNAETTAIAQWAPQGLLAGLRAGRTPPWLSPLHADPDEAVQIWAVRPGD